MRRYVGVLVLVVLLAGLIAAAGCGTSTKGIATPEGRVQYDSKTHQVSVTGSSSEEKTYTVKSTTEAALGVPVPSSAKVEKGSVAVISSTTGSEKWSGATLWSPDDVNTVISFYTDKLAGMSGYTNMSTVQEGQQIGLFTVKSGGETKSIVVGAGSAGDPGKTKIVIATVTGAK